MPNTIDFSKMERLTPREDSWSKVLARLDAAERNQHKTKIFSLYAAIPLAASFLLASAGILFFTISRINASSMPIQEVVSTELASWYESLGNETSDDLETLDETQSISYLLKETK